MGPGIIPMTTGGTVLDGQGPYLPRSLYPCTLPYALPPNRLVSVLWPRRVPEFRVSPPSIWPEIIAKLQSKRTPP